MTIYMWCTPCQWLSKVFSLCWICVWNFWGLDFSVRKSTRHCQLCGLKGRLIINFMLLLSGVKSRCIKTCIIFDSIFGTKYAKQQDNVQRVSMNIKEHFSRSMFYLHGRNWIHSTWSGIKVLRAPITTATTFGFMHTLSICSRSFSLVIRIH